MHRDPLLDLPLDAVPFRSPDELLFIAPEAPSWLRRNHSEVIPGREGPDDVYSLYCKTGLTLWRMIVGKRDDLSQPFSVVLSRWNDRLDQTRMHIPWDIIAEEYSALPESRDIAARAFMTTSLDPHAPTLRVWQTDTI